jgi:catechol 2,3-dioxygenase-like lactoylglutathione lyase family enzyme
MQAAHMEPRLSFVTLGVADLKRSTDFYAKVLRLPQLETPPTISFFELGRTYLALYPRTDLAADAGLPAPGAAAPGVFPGFTLSHNVRSAAEVDKLLGQVEAAGGRTVQRGRARPEFQGYSGYFADPDGFLWEVAYNPQFPHV